MGVSESARDPWGIVAAVVLGGMGGAVTAALAPAALLGVPVALAIAGAVYGVRVGLGALTDRAGGGVPAGVTGARQLPAPPRGSVAEGWLRRAERAVAGLRQQADTPDPMLRAQLAGIGDQAAAVLQDLHRFAGQVTLVEQAAGGIDRSRLTAESTTLRRALNEAPPGPLRDERLRALRALDDQLAVGTRLDTARETLLVRMQSTVLGVEGLVARVAELVTLHATSDAAPMTADRVTELTSDLEGLRAGLAEAERVSRSALAAGGTPGAVRPDGSSRPA